MRFLDALLEGKAAAKPLNADAVRRASVTHQSHVPQQPYSANWDLQRVTRDGFERDIWVHRAITAIASNGSRLPLVLRRGSETGELVENKPLHKLLNRRANSFETAANFRFRLSCQLLLSKQGVFVEVVRSRGGDPAELYLLPAGVTKPIPDPRTFVSGYEVRLPDGMVYELDPEQVVWIRQPHPLDPYLGTTPLEAAGLSVDTDHYARMYNRNFMLNDGRPGGLIGIKGKLNQADAAEVKRRFSTGIAGAGRTTVIEADDVSWVDTATTPRDAQYVEQRKLMKEEILLAFGVPESVIGNASGRTYDNADAEFDVFWRVTMQPHLDLIAGALDLLTEGGVEDEDFLVHDTSSISVLQRDERAREAKVLADFQSGGLTLDELLEATGREPLDVAASRVHWVTTAAKTPVGGSDEDTAVALALMNGQAPGAPAGEEEAPLEEAPLEEEPAAVEPAELAPAEPEPPAPFSLGGDLADESRSLVQGATPAGNGRGG